MKNKIMGIRRQTIRNQLFNLTWINYHKNKESRFIQIYPWSIIHTGFWQLVLPDVDELINEDDDNFIERTQDLQTGAKPLL